MIILLHCRLQIITYHMMMTLDVAAFRIRFRIRSNLIIVFQKIDSIIEFFYVLYSTLLHLPPPKFQLVGGCWDRTQECCDFGIGSQTLYNF
jgi:hypothetical protein